MAHAARSFKRENESLQPELLLHSVPAKLRAHGLQAGHVRPRVGRIRDKGPHAGHFWSGRVPLIRAWTYPWIDLQDAGYAWAVLVFDCDNRRAMELGLAGLPSGNVRIATERGAHVIWFLAVPVGKMNVHRREPKQKLQLVSEYYHHELDADPAFNGLGRNPVHPDAETTWGAKRAYSLDALCDVIPFGWHKLPPVQSGIGRQVDLWDSAIKWAGYECNAGVSVLTYLHSINPEVGDRHGRPPMPDHVLGDIARRVEKSRVGWMARGDWHKPGFREKQARRGSAGGKAKAGKPVNGAVKASVTPEMTDGKLAAKLGVHRATLARWKASGKLAEKMRHLANAVSVSDLPKNCAQKTGENVGGRAAPQKNVDKSAAPQQTGNADGLPLDLTDHRDPATQRFWQDRAARIAAET